MSEFNGILVVTELKDGALTDASQELLTPARRLGDKSSAPVTALVLAGSSDDTSATETLLGQLGADTVISVKDDALTTYQPQLYTKAVADIVTAKKPAIVLFTGTRNAQDYAPRVAIRTDAGLVTQVDDLDLNGDNKLEATRSSFGETILSTVTTQGDRPQMVTVKKKAFPKPVADSSKSASVEAGSVDLSSVTAQSSFVSVEASDTTDKPRLEDADIIVSGGRGLKGPEHFELVESLASSLGAAVGASRAVVDAGWRPHAEQVGQTGKTVSPKVYFALGISGAIQHLVGMSTSDIIIAINRDENAPIFKTADFGIVGDVFEVVPKLTETIKSENLQPNV